VADLTTSEGRAAAIASCPEPDILINNSQGPLPGDFRHWSRADWIAALDDMMLGPIEMMRLVVDGMMARGFGRIVNIVSRSVKVPQAELGLSNGARSGLVGFAGGLARQTAARNVTINNLLPGIFDSDAQHRHIRGMLAGTGTTFEQVFRARAEASTAKRYGEPDEFGAYCAFLCSAHAGYITGQNLLIDGGGYPGAF
jgi:3-oxoacyl-[acyl-carrier protein] reductase